MIRLYDYWRSSASYRLRIALGLAGLAWETHSVDLLAGQQQSPEHLAINPQGLVPALEIDGQILTQSLAIIEYLDETRGIGLLPDMSIDRARVRALSYAIAMEIHPICNTRVAKHAVACSNGAITLEDWMQDFIGPGLAAFETMIGDADYCYGNRVSMADICLVPQVFNARRWGVDLTPMPKISRITGHLEMLPAFANAHPDKAPH